MLNKILVVEDLDSVGFGLSVMLKNDLKIKEVITSQHCNDAYTKHTKAINDKAPFDLLITDLSFIHDYRQTDLKTGEQLIQKVRSKDMTTPILVYTVDSRPLVVERLFKKYKINGYVLKGRNGLTYVRQAITTLLTGETYTSPDLKSLLGRKPPFEIDEYDLKLLSHLSNGLTQEEISDQFAAQGVVPCSLSSIEKRLNKLKDELQVKTTSQLIASAKDLGLI